MPMSGAGARGTVIGGSMAESWPLETVVAGPMGGFVAPMLVPAVCCGQSGIPRCSTTPGRMGVGLHDDRFRPTPCSAASWRTSSIATRCSAGTSRRATSTPSSSGAMSIGKRRRLAHRGPRIRARQIGPCGSGRPRWAGFRSMPLDASSNLSQAESRGRCTRGRSSPLLLGERGAGVPEPVSRHAFPLHSCCAPL